ncbi:hypothetical protein C0J52_06389 [Blattella germanica]|nr:hypothetical protein C0J52_06389 [Blattella germanica]
MTNLRNLSHSWAFYHFQTINTANNKVYSIHFNHIATNTLYLHLMHAVDGVGLPFFKINYLSSYLNYPN